jgi:hypothetical protein
MRFLKLSRRGWSETTPPIDTVSPLILRGPSGVGISTWSAAICGGSARRPPRAPSRGADLRRGGERTPLHSTGPVDEVAVAYLAPEEGGDVGEHLVADDVSVGVVDRLEGVQVTEQDTVEGVLLPFSDDSFGP